MKKWHLCQGWNQKLPNVGMMNKEEGRLFHEVGKHVLRPKHEKQNKIKDNI